MDRIIVKTLQTVMLVNEFLFLLNCKTQGFNVLYFCKKLKNTNHKHSLLTETDYCNPKLSKIKTGNLAFSLLP